MYDSEPEQCRLTELFELKKGLRKIYSCTNVNKNRGSYPTTFCMSDEKVKQIALEHGYSAHHNILWHKWIFTKLKLN